MNEIKDMSPKQSRTFIQAILGGSLAGLCLSGSLPLLMPFATACLWSASDLAWASFCWGGIAVLVSHRWLLFLHPISWIGIPNYLSLPITISIWLACGLFGAILVATWSAFGNIFRSNLFKNPFLKNKIIFGVFLSVIWGLGENLLAEGPLFWIGIEETLLPSDRILAGLARWIGSGGLASLELLIGWWIWQIYIYAKDSKRVLKIFIFGMITFIICHAIGFILLIDNPNVESTKVALWQTNIPIRDKFNKNQLELLPEKVNNALIQSKNLGASLLISPEGTLLANSSKLPPSPIKFLSGGFRFLDGSQKSSILFFDVGDENYTSALDKSRLVPLGEWIPNFNNILKAGLSGVGGLSPGQSSRLFNWDGPSFAGTICYEISNGKAIKDAVSQGAKWILSIANLDPYPEILQKQFLSIAQLRSIETSRDLITVANTGPTSLIKSSGIIQELLPPFEDLIKVVDLEINHKRTVYSYLGQIPLVVVLLISFFRCLHISIYQ